MATSCGFESHLRHNVNLLQMKKFSSMYLKVCIKQAAPMQALLLRDVRLMTLHGCVRFEQARHRSNYAPESLQRGQQHLRADVPRYEDDA